MDDAKGKVEKARRSGFHLMRQFAAGRTVVFQDLSSSRRQEVNGEGLEDHPSRNSTSVADCEEEHFYAQEQARRQLEVEEKAAANMVQAGFR